MKPLSPFLSRWYSELIGLGAGVLNGLLGIGGGIFIVPGMILLRGATPQVAVATSLGTMLILSLVAFTVHVWVSGLYFGAWGTLLLLAASAAGSQVGHWLLLRLSQRWMLILFSLLTLFSAGNLAWKAYMAGMAPLLPIEPPVYAYAVLGGLAGFFSGLLGIGGGGLTVLGFAVLFHTPILGGLPLALGVNIVNSAAGVAAQWKAERVQWREVLKMVPAALAGIALGAVLAIVLPANTLRIVFALFFVYMGLRLFKKGLHS